MEFNNIYSEIVSHKNLDDIKNKMYCDCHNLKFDKNERFCIFCGKKAPEVKFSNKAHAISETLGNKILFNALECDTCNHAFGDTFEDALGKYLMPLKMASGCFGKKNIMTIKDQPDKSSGISYETFRMERRKTNNQSSKESDLLDNYVITNQKNLIFKEVENGIKMCIPREKHDPRLVYIALLKMAYSLIPIEKLKFFQRQINLLYLFTRKKLQFSDVNEREKYLNNLLNVGILAFISGKNPFEGVNTYLYENYIYLDSYPRLVFRIDFYNFSISIPVLDDRQYSGNFTLIYPYDINKFSGIFDVDFKKYEKFFSCTFSGKKIKISNEELAEKLRAEKLLKP